MLSLPHYQIKKEIYNGKNSIVYRAFREIDAQPVVLKWIKNKTNDPNRLTRYRREYDIIYPLNLKSVIKVYGIEPYKNTLVLILEDFGGKSLKEHLKLKLSITKRALTVEEFLPLAIRLTESLKEIHAAYIIHRDINPRNIVWNALTDQLKIIDFGLAVKLTSAYSIIQGKKDQLIGTVSYISPEQTGKTEQIIDYRTDLYALGATFYELLSGKPPFSAESYSELIQHHLQDTPPPIRQRVPTMQEIVSDVVMKLLAKDSKARYQSAAILQKDLELCLCRLQFKPPSSRFINL